MPEVLIGDVEFLIVMAAMYLMAKTVVTIMSLFDE